MALAAVKITVGQSLGEGRHRTSTKGGAVPDIATVVANTATLVADGVSPTQAHVNTLNTNVTALNNALAGHVVVMWDASVVTTRNQLRRALEHALQSVKEGYGGLSE